MHPSMMRPLKSSEENRMIRLNLGNSAEIIEFRFPLEWDPAALSGLTLTINDQSGNKLADAAAATLYTEAALDSDSRRYSREIVLEDNSDELAVGDPIRLSGILGHEDHTVKGWDSDNLTAELEKYVDRDFAAGSTVNRLSATIEVDLSDTDTFPAGTELLLIWTPTGTGGQCTREAVISAYQQMDLAGLRDEMQDIYPRAYDALTAPRDRLARVASRARGDIRSRLLIMDPAFEINSIRDQDVLVPAIAAQCAVLWTLNGDDDLEMERETYKGQVEAEIDVLSKLNIWVDEDDDLIEDPLENREHNMIFHKGW